MIERITESLASSGSDAARDNLKWLLEKRRKHLGAFLGTCGDLLSHLKRFEESARAYTESAEYMSDERSRKSKLEKAARARERAKSSR
jgi:hypothetical protein